jgi:hypothetical protein
MTAQVDRDQFKNSFAPIIPHLEDVIDDARTATHFDRIAKAIPELVRRSGIARVSGTARWVLAADGLVDRAGDFPQGYCVHSTDAHHNQGKYIFGFPLGIFTFKREPHEENKGLYLHETLEILKEQQPLASGVDAFAGLKVYISIPPQGTASVIVEGPAAGPMTFLLDEFVVPAKVVAAPRNPIVPATIRSAKSVDSKEGADAPEN